MNYYGYKNIQPLQQLKFYRWLTEDGLQRSDLCKLPVHFCWLNKLTYQVPLEGVEPVVPTESGLLKTPRF